MIVNTMLGPIDESLLQKVEEAIDNDNEHTTSIEYCLKDCDGPAHKTGNRDSDGHFCNKHIHRSAAVYVKQGLNLEGGIGKLS